MQKQCLICGRESVEDFLPFCSKRCKDVDLGRWFSGYYAVPVEEDPVPDMQETS